MQIQATIQEIKYQPHLNVELQEFSFNTDVNTWKPYGLLKVDNNSIAFSKWVSPKRTRSYPYARVYNTLNSLLNKLTIIPLIKDEGKDGDCDYLQWDTISLMSLLNVYVIIGYYDDAEKVDGKDKITNQKFNDNYVKEKITALSNYHSSALHWNLEQLSNLTSVLKKVKKSYANISSKLNVKMHNFANFDKFGAKICDEMEKFKEFSREKAKQAQNREIKTIQPKEILGSGDKTPITITNYLGGEYHFTIDEVWQEEDKLILCEAKHSKSATLPSIDDIKDGLLKMVLYTNFAKIFINKKNVEGKPMLKLTSTKDITEKEKMLLDTLKQEAIINNFTLLVEKI